MKNSKRIKMNIYLRSMQIIRNDGLRVFGKRLLLRLIYSVFPNNFVRKFVLKGTMEERFTKIYKFNVWNSIESSSGGGSSPIVTRNFNEKFPLMIEKFCIKSICDAPCGDFKIMEAVCSENNIYYTGVDIVEKQVLKLQTKSTERIKFIHGDILKYKFAPVDLLLVRDFLFHLSFDDIDKFLKHISSLSFDYLLTTSYETTSEFCNTDIATGDFRYINLLKEPFNFDKNFLFSIEEKQGREPIRYLYLWKKEDIPTKLSFS